MLVLAFRCMGQPNSRRQQVHLLASCSLVKRAQVCEPMQIRSLGPRRTFCETRPFETCVAGHVGLRTEAVSNCRAFPSARLKGGKPKTLMTSQPLRLLQFCTRALLPLSLRIYTLLESIFLCRASLVPYGASGSLPRDARALSFYIHCSEGS